MAEKRSSYKYCLVPKCLNTNRSAPGKYFFPVPRHKKLRKRWCIAMKRVDREPLSYKTSLHCCQDHFDIDNDVENYVKYKLIGGRMVLKSGVLPHKFDCQHNESNNSPQDITHSPIFYKDKYIEPLDIVACDLRDDINEMRSLNEINVMNRNEFSNTSDSVKNMRKLNNYKSLKSLCNVPFEMPAIDNNMIS